MNYSRRAAAIGLFVSFVLISTAAMAAESQGYNVTSGRTSLTFVPRPDLGFVTRSNESAASGQAIGEILSSSQIDYVKKVRGLNNRNFSV